MTSLSMFLSFLLLIVGGYGFSSTKVASLNIPLMQKIAPTVHSWAFLNPLLCGLLLFVYAVFSVSKKHAALALQITSAVLCVLFLGNSFALYAVISAWVGGYQPTLEQLLIAESGVGALIFLLAALRALRRNKQLAAKPLE